METVSTFFVHNVSIFCGFRKIVLGVIEKWSSEAALNFEFYLSDWHFRLTQFTAVLISNTASDGDLTLPFLPGSKISRSTPAFNFNHKRKPTKFSSSASNSRLVCMIANLGFLEVGSREKDGLNNAHGVKQVNEILRKKDIT